VKRELASEEGEVLEPGGWGGKHVVTARSKKKKTSGGRNKCQRKRKKTEAQLPLYSKEKNPLAQAARRLTNETSAH